MPEIHYNGQTMEMSENQFLNLLKNIADANHVTAGTLCSAIGGFPDATGNLIKTHWNETGYDEARRLIAQIDREDFRELFSIQVSKIQDLCKLDDDLCKVVSDFFELPSPQTQQDYQKLAKMMSCSTKGPVWISESEYQNLVQQIRQTFEVEQDIKQQIDEKLDNFLQNNDNSTYDT